MHGLEIAKDATELCNISENVICRASSTIITGCCAWGVCVLREVVSREALVWSREVWHRGRRELLKGGMRTYAG